MGCGSGGCGGCRGCPSSQSEINYDVSKLSVDQTQKLQALFEAFSRDIEKPIDVVDWSLVSLKQIGQKFSVEYINKNNGDSRTFFVQKSN